MGVYCFGLLDVGLLGQMMGGGLDMAGYGYGVVVDGGGGKEEWARISVVL